MALQKSVNQSQALGFNGKIAQGTHSYFNTIGAVAGSDIEIGSFVQTKGGVVTQAMKISKTAQVIRQSLQRVIMLLFVTRGVCI